jgi:hypothetical protein
MQNTFVGHIGAGRGSLSRSLRLKFVLRAGKRLKHKMIAPE